MDELEISKQDFIPFSKCARCRRDMVRYFYKGKTLVLHHGGAEPLVFPVEYCLRIVHTFGSLKTYDGKVRAR